MAESYFRVHRSQLLPALFAVHEAVDGKASIPILANVLLQPTDGELRLRATDLSLEIETRCELLEEGSGAGITLSGSALRDIVKNLPENAEIEFTKGAFEGQVIIRAGRARFSLLSLPEGDFPSIASKVGGNCFDVSMTALSDAINKVMYAVSDEQTRYYLCGICLHPYADGQKMSVVGCDGHNLAVVRLTMIEPVDFPSVIVPMKMAKAMKKLIGASKANATLTISSALIRVECDGVTIISKLVDADYPDYMRTVPLGNPREAIGVVSSMRATIGRICVVAKDLAKEAVKVSLKQGGAELTLVTREGEEASDDIGIEYDGDDLEIGFNGSYLRNMLDSIQTQDVAMFFSDAMTPALFKPTVESDEFYIVMPMKL